MTVEGLPAPRRRRGRRRLAVVLLLLAALGVAWYAVHRAMPAWYARLWYPLEYVGPIREESARFGVDPELVAAVIYEESGFVSDSLSSRGAVGLMQVQPETARFVAGLKRRPSPSPERIAEPEVNIAYGTALLRHLIDRYRDTPLALAAYNAGTSNVDRWLADAKAAGTPFRVPADIPFGETRAYVADVLHTRGIYARAYGDRLAATP